ncbi:MAG: alpha/beta hydrolase [Chloroflexota bacterium]|nr:alpha/beta hydrolase [Chloroflexota bacterium]
MPYATNDGVRIYYEREGSGPPILMHHGFSMSHQAWREDGFVDALKDDYELVLFDQRGNGASDKPHDPADYTFDKRVADIVAVLDDAGIDRAVFWGYSLGGHVGYAIAQYAPERFRALIIGGQHPYARDPEPYRAQAERLRSGGMAKRVMEIEAGYGPIPPARRARILADDAEALAASSIAIGNAPSFADALANLGIPVLIYVGDRDGAYAEGARAVAGLPQVTFVTLTGCDHGQGGERADIVIPHVRAFLAGVTDTAHPQA